MSVDAVEAMKNNDKLQRIIKKQRLESEHKKKIQTLLKYYAATEVPVPRIVKHIGINEDEVLYGLKNYGRTV